MANLLCLRQENLTMRQREGQTENLGGHSRDSKDDAPNPLPS